MNKLKVLAVIGIVVGVSIVGGLYYANRQLDKLVLELADSVEQPTVEPQGKIETTSPESVVPPSNNSSSLEAQQANNRATVHKAANPAKKAQGKTPTSVETSDKAKVIEMITSKLPSSAIAELKTLARGGATPENIAKAKAILKAHLSAADIEELRRIARKYKVK